MQRKNTSQHNYDKGTDALKLFRPSFKVRNSKKECLSFAPFKLSLTIEAMAFSRPSLNCMTDKTLTHYARTDVRKKEKVL